MVYNRYIKRLFDFIGAVFLLIILSPLFLIIALIIVADSGFPIIYKQIRVGQNGCKFTIYKFRTMVNDADKSGTNTLVNDIRITRIGKILRRTSMDELPQLVNVLIGNMSFIGFRPDVPRDYSDFSRKKWMTKPGITGYAQINGRSNLTLEEIMYWEDKYVSDMSFLTDWGIILKTFKIVIVNKDSN